MRITPRPHLRSVDRVFWVVVCRSRIVVVH